jgi:cysteine synthase
LKDEQGNPQIVEYPGGDDAFAMARRLAKEEGILAGISQANVVAAEVVTPENLKLMSRWLPAGELSSTALGAEAGRWAVDGGARQGGS